MYDFYEKTLVWTYWMFSDALIRNLVFRFLENKICARWFVLKGLIDVEGETFPAYSNAQTVPYSWLNANWLCRHRPLMLLGISYFMLPRLLLLFTVYLRLFESQEVKCAFRTHSVRASPVVNYIIRLVAGWSQSLDDVIRSSMWCEVGYKGFRFSITLHTLVWSTLPWWRCQTCGGGGSRFFGREVNIQNYNKKLTDFEENCHCGQTPEKCSVFWQTLVWKAG